MNIHTLGNTPITTIRETFNLAFSDYVIPFQLTLEQLQSRMLNDNIDLNLSIGAFDKERLVGFILHGHGIVNGEKVVYNGGTGVIPTYRGTGITKQLYAYMLPILKQAGYKKCKLEVIDSNLPAIRSYEKIGFTTMKPLNCHRGLVTSNSAIQKGEIEELISYDHCLQTRFGDWEPSWQNSTEAILRSTGQIKTIVLLEQKHIIGYATFNPSTGRIPQFAIDKNFRRKRYGTRLFNEIARQVGKEIVLINTDGRDTATNEFLSKIGLKLFIRQLEMELIIE